MTPTTIAPPPPPPPRPNTTVGKKETGPATKLVQKTTITPPAQPDVVYWDANRNANRNNKKAPRKKQMANRARHRLLSIHRDSELFLSSHRLNEMILQAVHQRMLPSQHAAAATIMTRARTWPIIPNERCGSWYVPPPSSSSLSVIRQSSSRCYFKSTDGHRNTWNFSFKRLNLHLLDALHNQQQQQQKQRQEDGTAKAKATTVGCILVDSSVRKLLPDSFARTIPIWASVLNRMALRYRTERGSIKVDEGDDEWDTALYTPECLVSREEHETISNSLLDDHVEALYRSGAIVNPDHYFLKCLTKPLRPCWITNGGTEILEPSPSSSSSSSTNVEDYFWIVCVNPSTYHWNKATQKNQIVWHEQVPNTSNEDSYSSTMTNTTSAPNKNKSGGGFYYMSGAADDEESWARKLTPELFWEHASELLKPTDDADSLWDDDDEFDQRIDQIVSQSLMKQEQPGGTMDEDQDQDGKQDHARNFHQQQDDDDGTSMMNRIGNLPLWIGSRRAGRPPQCWEHFDAILNVTDHQYEGMKNDGSSLDANSSEEDSGGTKKNQPRFYLQLSVAEGKRDRTELERWMPVGTLFLIMHLQQGRHVLVHCNQGKDRSVAVVLAFLCVACPLTFPVNLDSGFQSWRLQDIIVGRTGSSRSNIDTDDGNRAPIQYVKSGLSKSLVDTLLDETKGSDTFLQWIHSQKQAPTTEPLADKERLRIALQLIRQDRVEAEPSRSTMQKLNRFFMSSPMYRNEVKGTHKHKPEGLIL